LVDFASSELQFEYFIDTEHHR